jgi:hypothetical protein
MEDTQQRQISLDCYLNRSNAAVQRILKKHFQRPAGLAQRYLLTITGFFLHRKRIAELPIAGKLAVIGPASLMVEAGLLMSYGANWWAVARSAAPLVKKILEGENPGNIPVQQPTIFELAFNLKTAQAIGLQIPPIMLARATQVFD